LSEPLPSDNWQGRTGLVHQAVMHDFLSLEMHQVYACGVPVMVKAAYHDFITQCHLPRDAFFSDVFTPSTSNP
jgi:CDP-4-dehydro-6-deoxyglucose reductase